jgi:hypothetical protein
MNENQRYASRVWWSTVSFFRSLSTSAHTHTNILSLFFFSHADASLFKHTHTPTPLFSNTHTPTPLVSLVSLVSSYTRPSYVDICRHAASLFKHTRLSPPMSTLFVSLTHTHTHITHFTPLCSQLCLFFPPLGDLDVRGLVHASLLIRFKVDDECGEHLVVGARS